MEITWGQAQNDGSFQTHLNKTAPAPGEDSPAHLHDNTQSHTVVLSPGAVPLGRVKTPSIPPGPDPT